MSIPFYVGVYGTHLQDDPDSPGGSIFGPNPIQVPAAMHTMDDRSLYTELANVDGDNGLDYRAFVVTRPIAGRSPTAFNKLRRVEQRVETEDGCTLSVRAAKDGQETGPILFRTVQPQMRDALSFPISILGSEFALRFEFNDFTDQAALGSAAFWILPKRSRR